MDWDALLDGHRCVVDEIAGPLREAVEAVAAAMWVVLHCGHKIMACGNGGSAADAQHFAAELVNRFQMERRPYAALALTTDASVLTSIANDYAYARVFSKQVEALACPGDLLLAISTSGNAENVCLAAEAARAAGAQVVALCGGTGGRLASLADHVLCISSSRVTARIQEGHAILIHALCQMVEAKMASFDLEQETGAPEK